MNFGVFRDGLPRVRLKLPGINGPVVVEFVIDTGFEGDLCLPGFLARQLDAAFSGSRTRLMADGRPVQCPVYEFPFDWNDGIRLIEVIVLEGRPLLGTTFMAEQLLQVEITEGGEAALEPL